MGRMASFPSWTIILRIALWAASVAGAEVLLETSVDPTVVNMVVNSVKLD